MARTTKLDTAPVSETPAHRPVEWPSAMPPPPATPLRASLREVTPALAAELLNRARYDQQRPLSEASVQYLMQTMYDGTFKTSVVELYRVGQRGYLIDGQHRLTAIVRTGLTIPLIMIKRDVETEEEVAQAYARTDRGKTRSFVDVYRAYGLAEKTELSRSQVANIGAAVTLLIAGFTAGAHRDISARSADRRAEMVLAWAPEGAAYYGIVGGRTDYLSRRLNTSGVVAVGLVTCRYCPERAATFWNRVAYQEHLVRTDPEYALVRLLENQADTSASRAHMRARAAAAAWNAAYTGQPKEYIKGLHATTPMRILGTPYRGKDVVLGHQLPPRTWRAPASDRNSTEETDG